MSYVPTNLYEVRFYDHDGAFQILPKNVVRIEFHQRINAAWNHQVTLEYSKDDDQVSIIRSIAPDWYVRIFRIDPITQIRSLVYSGLHITLVDQARANGDLIFNLYGSGYTQLLTRRVVVPNPTYEESTKIGAAEFVLKGFIADCMITPLDSDRIFPGVSSEISTDEGEIVEYSARYINLMTVCENVANAGKIDFGLIEGNSVGEVIVRARSVWGKDRREGNTAGNPETKLSFLRGTMDIPIYTNNTSDEKTFVYVGGEGQGAERNVLTVSAAYNGKWGRKEAFIEGRQQGSTLSLVSVGNAYLEDKKQTETLSFDIIQTIGSRWLVDWDLGDLITARYFDKVFDKKIVEVAVVVSGESSSQMIETVTVELEDVRNGG